MSDWRRAARPASATFAAASVVVCLTAMPLAGQTTEEEEFRRFQDRERAAVTRFAAREDSAFATYLTREWREYRAFAAGRPYKAPKLPAPPVVAPDTAGETIVSRIPSLPPAPPARTTGTPGHRPSPVALLPRAPALVPAVATTPFRTAAVPFFGAPVPVRYARSPIPALGSPVNGTAIAAFYRGLAAADWGILAEDLRAQSEALALDDYAYAQFVLRLGRLLAGDEPRARLLTWYLLLKSNVDARVGYVGSGGGQSAVTIMLLVPSTVGIFATPFFTIGGERYYAVSLDAGPPQTAVGPLFTYDGNAPGSPRKADLRVGGAPRLAPEPESRTLTWRYGETEHRIVVRADRTTVRYFEWFPQVDWDVWFGLRMSDAARQSLLPQLRALIAGRSERDAANFLIRFVQRAFAYKTDGEQFGREKPLGVDETLLYPYSDCEDRSILFAALVRELLGLEVVGLLYPGHMATAVRFRQDTSGDAVLVGNERWVVSDPTYIGADVGSAMPQFKAVVPEVVRIR